MGDKTKIEWTDATWNPIRGCSRVSEGCRNCYAETVANRFSGEGQPYEGLIARGGQWNGKIKLVEHMLDQPLRWQRPRRVFVNSMSDLFHENVPFEYIAAIFSIMGVTTRHTYQILTKRPDRMLEFFDWAFTRTDEDGEKYRVQATDFDADDRISSCWPSHIPWRGYDNCGPRFPYENVWLGVSVEDQATANERIPLLLDTPAAVRWISAEPLLGPVDLLAIEAHMPGGGRSLWDVISPRVDRKALGLEGDPMVAALLNEGLSSGHAWAAALEPRLDWVVVGGESGKGARPMHPDWARSLRNQCVDAGVPFLFKQWGDWAPLIGGPQYIDDDPEISRYQWAEWMDEKWNFLGRLTWSDDTDEPNTVSRVGKKKAGRLLDGRTWDQYPEESA